MLNRCIDRDDFLESLEDSLELMAPNELADFNDHIHHLCKDHRFNRLEAIMFLIMLAMVQGEKIPETPQDAELAGKLEFWRKMQRDHDRVN